MATVISSDSIDMHSVNKYNFKIIASVDDEEFLNSVAKEERRSFTENNNPKARAGDKIDSSALSNSSKESLIESLMKKTDDMSSNFIKLQMKLEAKEEEFEVSLKKAKEDAFAEGLEAGKAKAIEEGTVNVSEAITLFSESVQKLNAQAEVFDSALEGIKKDLILAALDIAQEVVSVEIGENSNNIAEVLSKELIKDLQGASKITLKVNPKDHGPISQKLGSIKYVEVISDSAISEGGVVAISDVGNVDAEISKRFQRVKKAALSE